MRFSSNFVSIYDNFLYLSFFEQFKELACIFSIFSDENLAVTVVSNVLAGFKTVSRINACRNASC